METDLFASLRKRDTGVSTSFVQPVAKHPKHPADGDATPENPQKTEAKHPKHTKHPSQQGSGIEQAQNHLSGISERDNEHLPREWRLGLNRLIAMRPPSGATADRWRQIVIDAHVLAWGWHDEAIGLAWSIGSLFGYQADQADGFVGLALDVRGGRVVNFWRDERGRDAATIQDPGGRYRCHYRHMPDDAPPIWALGARDNRR